MYVPQHFSETDVARLHAHPFATLISVFDGHSPALANFEAGATELWTLASVTEKYVAGLRAEGRADGIAIATAMELLP